jgi:hypothetical protein
MAAPQRLRLQDRPPKLCRTCQPPYKRHTFHGCCRPSQTVSRHRRCRQQVRAHLGYTDMVDASHHVLSSERQGHCHRVAVRSGRCPKWQQCTRNVRVPAGLNKAAQQHYRERNEPQPLNSGRLCSAFITM